MTSQKMEKYFKLKNNMKRKSYIKNLEFNLFQQFNKTYLTTKYERNKEYNKITFKVDKDFKATEKNIRKFLNN